MVVAVAVFASSRRAGDHLQHPSTTIDTTVSNSLPYPTLSAPQVTTPTTVQALARLIFSAFRSSQVHPPHIHSTRLLFRLPIQSRSFILRAEAASYYSISCWFILPSHQFLHSIPSCFLIPTYWLSLLLHLNTSHAHTSAAFNHRH